MALAKEKVHESAKKGPTGKNHAGGMKKKGVSRIGRAFGRGKRKRSTPTDRGKGERGGTRRRDRRPKIVRDGNGYGKTREGESS